METIENLNQLSDTLASKEANKLSETKKSEILKNSVKVHWDLNEERGIDCSLDDEIKDLILNKVTEDRKMEIIVSSIKESRFKSIEDCYKKCDMIDAGMELLRFGKIHYPELVDNVTYEKLKQEVQNIFKKNLCMEVRQDLRKARIETDRIYRKTLPNAPMVGPNIRELSRKLRETLLVIDDEVRLYFDECDV